MQAVQMCVERGVGVEIKVSQVKADGGAEVSTTPVAVNRPPHAATSGRGLLSLLFSERQSVIKRDLTPVKHESPPMKLDRL